MQCTHLRAANLPAAAIIGASAFRGCTLLETADLPAAKAICEGAFHGCVRLRAVALGAPMIGAGAFAQCVWRG
jgi:hypothetical protein